MSEELRELDPITLRYYLKDHEWTDHVKSDQSLGKPQPPLVKPYDPNGEIVDLPAPEKCALKHNDLSRAFVERKSNRLFKKESISLEELSYLLFNTQGIRDYRPGKTATLRTVPSAGARHPFETYLACMNVEGLKRAVYRYLPEEHKLLLVREYGDDMEDIVGASANKQIFVGRCAVTFFWSAVMYRSEWRYPTHAQKVVLIDVGHVCQNLYLACEAIGCGTCGIGAYNQQKVDELCEIDGVDEFVVYLAPVGRV